MRLTVAQKKVILAAFLGWMLDAFDFFLLVTWKTAGVGR
jgi:hypothetical protein